ncbi:MAG TPA: SEC-C metal-binding domain-containing protein [Ramlibacter sp.]|uniref:YecA family protein n=1 Tax=Ramlibacter sp. TaxID=1917967 RepID=UPI002BFBEBED|nr:SEC-C metal-binding domain-containing protein [Ramlibacter sp.]HVZ42528.1 SEC-C metal-binding domain-containing protein [Ramlibacter sp.]
MRSLVFECIASVSKFPATGDSAPFDALEREQRAAAAQCVTDAERDDLFVLRVVADFVDSYRTLWSQILAGQYESSWRTLQDCLDDLRLVRRFSDLSIAPFEDQLLELETAYLYTVFFSMGATVERYECSICRQDIDSSECSHRAGHLYGGILAQGIAREITDIDHISMVTIPKDKRCVVSYADDSSAFQVVRAIGSLVSSGRMRIRDFATLRWSKQLQKNPNFRRVGRNDPCFCGSTKKFKRCCVDKREIELDHVDVVGGMLSYSEAFDVASGSEATARA